MDLLISDLPDIYSDNVGAAVYRVSFEDRSTAIARAIQALHSKPVLVFSSDRADKLAKNNLHTLLSLNKEASNIRLDIKDPLQLADRISEVKAFCESAVAHGRILIDITCFRREELLILMRVLSGLERPMWRYCELLYVSAASMAEDWLSKNTVEYRSVIGYSGLSSPARRSHLIVMVGFEVERARDIIANYEPAKLTIGYGRQAESINAPLYHRNIHFFEQLKSLYGADVDSFDFSLTDPLKAAREISAVVSKTPDMINIVAPLNNKISTIGAGLVGISKKEVQICYGVVSEYNVKSYSTVGDKVYRFNLADLLEAGLSASH